MESLEPLDEKRISYCVRILKIPESELRDYRWVYDRDADDIRLWNHRKVRITGLELHEAFNNTDSKLPIFHLAEDAICDNYGRVISWSPHTHTFEEMIT